MRYSHLMHFLVFYFILIELAIFKKTNIYIYLPCQVKVYFPVLVIAPPSIDRGTEDSILGFLQSGEVVFQEALKT